jgi:vitamin B12 transporter
MYETEISGSIQEVDDYKDKGYGSSAKLVWKNTSQTVVFGADYDDKTFKSDFITGGEQKTQKWAVYANDTVLLNKLAITPGIRYDDTDPSESSTSPSLGMAYSFSNSTILRLYAAKGFNIPPLGYTYADNIVYTPNPDLKTEKVLSYQAGAETAAMKYFWMKLSVFWNEIRDAISSETSLVDPTKFTFVNAGRQRRRGIDFEVKTHPVYNTSLSAGAEYVDAKDLDTGERVDFVPTHIYDVGLRYDDGQSFKALLQGRYINWNTPPNFNGKYTSFVFDLHLTKKIHQHQNTALEIFADVHNLFNGSQYAIDTFKNPERWYEGGIRYKF